MSKFLSNWIVRNLILAVIFVLGLVLLVNIFLAVLTQHNNEIQVPDLSGLTYSEAVDIAGKAGVKLQVTDSVYSRHSRKGVVYSQIPSAGSSVKHGRRIQLTMVAKGSQKVSMPSLVGFSMRQARAELTSKGLVTGRFHYVPDIATNNVLKQLFRGKEIKPGSQIDAGSAIDLVLGRGDGEASAYAPNVIGQKYEKAVNAVRDNSFNIGRLVFDKSVRTYNDTLNARVYGQKPVADGIPMPMGAEMTLYLTVDDSKKGN